jgi:hypothetical protein
MSPEHLVRLLYDAGDFGGFREHAIEKDSSSVSLFMYLKLLLQSELTMTRYQTVDHPVRR